MTKSILAISGSTRSKSTNAQLISAVSKLLSDKTEIIVYNDLARLPHFNPDDDHENVSPYVSQFRNLLRVADGVMICTPEYAMGLPGSLKNALDWTVSSMEFSGKPVMAITASLSGEKAHQSLMDTLKIIEAKNIDELQLLIQYAKSKFSKEGEIIDEETLKKLTARVADFERILQGKI